MNEENILEVKSLIKYFPAEKKLFRKTKKFIKAVDNITFTLKKGESLAIVGESGCGKTTLAKTIIGLINKNSGEVKINNKNIFEVSKKERQEIRTEVQMIFQDPYSSLNPMKRVKDIIGEAMLYHNIANKENLEEKVVEVMELCGLPKEYIDRYPREFSGGQRQRIGIARAIALKPKVIIADEPVSALDVSMQAQIINLMIELQEKIGMSYLFISHDLALVKYIANRVAVMYLGSIVEIGDKNLIYKNTKHPYTIALMESVPIMHPRDRRKKEVVKGEASIKSEGQKGCKFSERCKYSKEICKEKEPILREVEKKHFVACHMY
ncbi:ABC transporter ATP-binding protein [Clostridium massiliamazoniense]|uniref:ABC transporter ATP-binding protein n=1 Tax=Clostridium massiliamazoniense TaxID=1347366 RepID=UPI0006D7B133|nr:oligopeptide/dipeptide ABC transporter ATP-binding protein [Clostridium massiliamazoniense]